MEEIRFPFPGVRKCLIDDPSPQELNLVTLIVEPSFRRKGVGGAVLAHVKKLAKLRKKKFVRLLAIPTGEEEFQVDAVDLKRFYKKNGFALQRDNETMICYV